MPTLKILGYEAGLKKIVMTKLLQQRLELSLQESKEITDAVISGNVISLEIEDADLANDLAEELSSIGARIQIEEN